MVGWVAEKVHTPGTPKNRSVSSLFPHQICRLLEVAAVLTPGGQGQGLVVRARRVIDELLDRSWPWSCSPDRENPTLMLCHTSSCVLLYLS